MSLLPQRSDRAPAVRDDLGPRSARFDVRAGRSSRDDHHRGAGDRAGRTDGRRDTCSGRDTFIRAFHPLHELGLPIRPGLRPGPLRHLGSTVAIGSGGALPANGRRLAPGVDPVRLLGAQQRRRPATGPERSGRRPHGQRRHAVHPLGPAVPAGVRAVVLRDLGPADAERPARTLRPRRRRMGGGVATLHPTRNALHRGRVGGTGASGSTGTGVPSS